MDQKDIVKLVALTALNYYEESGRLEIRRRDLLELCLETDSQLPTSSFNRTMNSLELQLAFKKIVNKKHKETMIELYPDNIRRILKEMHVGKTYREVQVQEKIWTKIMNEEMTFSKTDKAIVESVSNLATINRRFCYQLIRKGILQLVGEIFSRHFQFYISDSSSNTYRILNESAVRHLWLASKEIARQQQNMSFTIVAQYTGMPQDREGYKIWTMQIYSTLIPYFVIFIRDCLKKELGDELEDQLNSRDYSCLNREPFKTYWKIFSEVYLAPIIRLYANPMNS